MNTPTVFHLFALLFFVNVFSGDGEESVKRPETAALLQYDHLSLTSNKVRPSRVGSHRSSGSFRISSP